MTVLLPWDGSQRGRETDPDPKQPGVALWRRRQTNKDGTHHGQEQDRQETTDSSGGKMFGPCAPLE